MFLPNKTIKIKNLIINQKKCGSNMGKMLLPNKIIKNKKLNYPPKNVALHMIL